MVKSQGNGSKETKRLESTASEEEPTAVTVTEDTGGAEVESEEDIPSPTPAELEKQQALAEQFEAFQLFLKQTKQEPAPENSGKLQRKIHGVWCDVLLSERDTNTGTEYDIVEKARTVRGKAGKEDVTVTLRYRLPRPGTGPKVGTVRID